MQSPSEPRYRKMIMTPLGVNFVHTCNPWVAVWWSVALPGLGHFYLGAHLKGFILMSLEIILNNLSHLNLAIYHSLLGDVARAREVLVMKWAFLYPAVYLLSFWDAYRLAVELNWLAKLEAQQPQRHFNYQHLCIWGHGMLVKRSPWVAWFWSTFVFGAGHLYNSQLLKGAMLMGWQIALIALASASNAVYLTLLGQGRLAAESVDYQWLLFLPSMYLFSMWDAYHDCVEQNKLAEEAQWDWLGRQRGRAGDSVRTVVGVVLTTKDLELALLALQRRGFPADAIRWGRLERRRRPSRPDGLREWLMLGGTLGDTFRRADGISLMDGATAGATIGSLAGVVYGSVLAPGPIGGGVAGLLGGGFVGWLCDRWISRGRSRDAEAGQLQRLGCIIQVTCPDADRVKEAKEALEDAEVVLVGVME